MKAYGYVGKYKELTIFNSIYKYKLLVIAANG